MLIAGRANGQLCLSRTSMAWLNSVRTFQTSSVMCKKQAGRYQVTRKQNKPLTYEQAMAPHQIGVEKSWNSWNTSTLEEGVRKSETATEDFFIRKFVTGTWHKLFLSELIIKRRGNIVIISGIVAQAIHPRKLYFLLGYTEEMLSYVIKCPVKLELQTLQNRRDMIFKYI
ncbi:28S ribosomal protein S24, mitochondrial [Halotydeus destructor]|nr:28S ribosomal protein S24, mitochondrial [Halotydeus destructor]